MRNFHNPGRSAVYGRRAMAATSHPLASETAVRVLREGGNAVDAAIATAAVLCVVEHPMTGIGGDCFAMIAKPDGSLTALNGSGRAPAAATADWYARAGIKSIETTTPHAVTVPGAIAGWTRLLADHGTRSLGDLLQPAIGFARDGFAIAPRVGFDWARAVPKIERHAGARRHLLLEGRAPRVGEVMRFPALAATLETIARAGRDGFYTGAVASDLVATLKAAGGLHTEADFARQDATYVTPVTSVYNGATIAELPPNNHGIVALILLGMLERLSPPKGDPLSPERFHLLMESSRLAFAARDAFVADPDAMRVPVAHLLSAPFLDELAGRIDRRRRRAELGPMPRPAGSDTVCFSIVDEQGLAVSFINSLFADFGSGIVGETSGVTLHNRGQGFVLDPAHDNCIGPGKRPLHTLVPAIALKGGAPWLAFGVMGAAYQPLGHVQLLTNMIDFGLDLQSAIDLPRMFFEGDAIVVEQGVSGDLVSALQAMGHDRIIVRPAPWGGAQAVEIDRARGVLIGGSDPRKDGCAIGY